MLLSSLPLHLIIISISHSHSCMCLCVCEIKSEREMAKKLASSVNADEDYIEMEVSSCSNYDCYSISSPQHSKEFEFPMSSSASLQRVPSISPADELFYKGKLLPLHLPPRLQMVQKLLQNSNTPTNENKTDNFRENYKNPSINAKSTRSSTPLESCNVSPSRSCRISRELNPNEYFFECSSEVISFIDDHTKKSWLKNLKLIKQSSLGMKLKASGDYFKSLFSKTRCSDESCAEAIRRNATEEVVSIGNECLNKYNKVGKKNPFGQIQNQRYEMTASVMRATNKEKTNDDNSCSQRRSFSGVIKQCSSSSSSYSSVFSSANTDGFYELHLLKRSSSDNSETENAILGAIAHCKQTPVALVLKERVPQ